MQPVKTKKKLSRADKKQIEAAIARANRTDKKGKSAQDSIPYERMWPDGICRISDSHYTKTIQFQDINYQLSQNEDKTAIFEGWCDFLNYFDSSIHFQLSFLNLAASEETFANSISIPPQRDAFDSIREEYTTMLQNQLARGNNGLIKTKYLTFGIDADSIKVAKPRLERIETDILNNFKRLGVAARTLDGKERLSQLHAVFHMDEQLPFQFEWDWLAPSGLSTKDFIAPSSFEFRTGKQFRMGKKYGAVSFLQILAPELNDRLLADFLDMESSLIVSMHIQSVDQVKAIKTVKRKITDLDRSKIEEQKKAVRAGYDMDIIPSDLATYGSEAKKLLQDLQSRNERMFLLTFLVLNTADNPRQLGNNIFQAGSIAQKYNCQLTRLDFQQEEGLMSCLPLGLNQIEIQRGLTTSSTAIFVPFTTQELFQNGKEALYYGINALSNNLIMVDRKLLKNPNGLILGTPGSGKSFSAKREIANCFLLTSDDVIICDPEAEYAPLVERLHGQVIKISPTSTNYINPMDLNLDYSDDESPLSLKSDFILSLCELIVGGKEGLQPVQKTIIDRCVRLVYNEYLNDPKPENMPILEDLYNLLREQEEKEAQYIATALEIYVTGSLNVFNHQSNVDAPFIQQVMSDAEQIADAETEQTSEVSISDEEYDAVRRPIPQKTSYDPAAPVYAVGDTVYIEDDAYQITELREDTVQLLPTGMVYPIYRAERKEQFEQLLRADRRNAYYTEFLPIDPDKADQDLRDVLAHGLMDEADKKQISTLLQSGRSNSEIAYWLSRAYSGGIETLNLETGDIADYRTTAQGVELEVMDAEEKRLAMLYFRWDEVAPLLRGMYARQQDGFGQEQPQPATESPTFHSETMAVYPGDKNHLPYDVVVERLHIEEPEPPAPVTEPEKTFEEVLDEHPVSIQVNGQWQTFPNAKAAEEASYEEYKANLRRNAKNFRITDEHLGEGGPKAKFQANVNAIRLLKELEAAGQQASPEQQEVLSRYVGWGGLSDAFEPEKPVWALEYAQLKELLTPEEYAAARSSTLNAHYTSPTVIQAIYEAVGRMGFETGNILEPSMGVGNFFGMLPEEMRNSRLYGVELDPVSGRIAKQLYPKADITVGGFETTDRRDFFDLAIGNVPFGQYQVNDKVYNKLNFNIHNYFFAKALDQVRPGGVVAFVTSRYTMDAKDSTVRRYLAQRAELLGTIRLPNDAFKKNAGAEVVSDIIFLQKRDRPLDIVPEWTQTGQTEDGFAINRYFIDHPEMVLGRQEPVSTAHGMDYTVNPIEELELSDQLHDAVKYIHGTYQEAELPELGEGEAIDTSIPADPNVKNYSYAIVDGQVYYRENSRMVRPDLNATAEARVKGLVGLRDCVQELIDLQMDAAVPDSTITQKQAELNSLYDSFSAKYGLINDRANRLAYADDSSYYLLCALEVIDEDGKLERKADMFTKRTIKPHQAVAVVDTASEALAVSISEKACVDMDYMSQLTGKTKEALAGELQGVIFRVPGQLEQDGTPHYVTADEYLSGNVRRKLRQAQRAAQQDPVYAVNVEALTAAQPKDLDASEIEVRLGATWIDKEYIQQFMYETFNTPFYLQRSIEVNYSSFTAEWQIKGKSSVSYNDVAAYTTYGTSRANAYKILEDSLNLRDVRIYDTIEDADGKERRALNAKETTLAAQKQQAIREAFRDWIWRDPERRQTLVRQYNEEMNSTRPREYDGSHITFGGMNPAITLREHQKSAIAHVLYGGNTLLAHEVGAGKTFEMVAASMEAKRLGLCQKSLFVVPNHLTEQWASEFLRLYPSANILVTTKKDFETHNRKKFCARIATGDYDAIIMGHSQFERIPISRERQERLLYEQIDEITEGIAEVQASGGERFTVKQLERTRKSLEARLEKLQAEGRKDDVVTFEQLGVDRLFVDEAHNYKNLFLYTKMRNVAGLSTSDAQKSSDMFAKCRYMDEITGNRGVIFATGTPVSNSMTELYTMQRYLQYERLQELNMTHFDCWASRFGETVTALELAPEGTGYRARTRFSKFFNLPELMNLFKEVADIKTADQLNLPTPEVEYHNIVAQPTEHQQEMVKALSERASLVHSGTVDPSQDNMLKITSDGRKLGLDQRIVNQMLPDEPGTKVNQCVDNIMQIWRDGKADKLTQLVFCDISTPQAKAPVSKAAKTLDNPLLHALEGAVPLPEQEPVFTVYDDIRQKLIAQGMPADQIAFIHEANTEVRKKELFSKVRTGQVRVLLGSTAKMGAGTNVQDRLVALHDLDCPWRPGDLAQRKGRIERQGNQNPLVHVYRYVTEGTFDAYLWQTVENKQKFISQIMTSKSPVRSCDDVDETALSFAEIKALCAGDPRIKERMDLDVEVSRLKLMKADHQSKQYRLEDQLLKYFPEEIEKHKGFIKGFESDLEVLAAHPHPEDGFAGMEIRGDLLTDKENAGAALLDACKEVKTSDPVQIGSYRGYAMSVEFSAWKQEYTLLLKGQMTHRATLGTDPRGNLTRIDNALAQMPQRLEAAKAQLDNLYQQQVAAKEEVGKPFLYEEELRSKNARLVELDTLLNIDGKGQAHTESVVAKSTRPSVLDNLKRPVQPRSTDKKPKQHEEVR